MPDIWHCWIFCKVFLELITKTGDTTFKLQFYFQLSLPTTLPFPLHFTFSNKYSTTWPWITTTQKHKQKKAKSLLCSSADRKHHTENLNRHQRVSSPPCYCSSLARQPSSATHPLLINLIIIHFRSRTTIEWRTNTSATAQHKYCSLQHWELLLSSKFKNK